MDSVFAAGGREVLRRDTVGTEQLFFGAPAPELTGSWNVVANGTYISAVDGPHEVSLVQAGRARVLVDGLTIVDGTDDPPPTGTAMFGLGSESRVGPVDLPAGEPAALTIELSNESTSLLAGATIGILRSRPRSA